MRTMKTCIISSERGLSVRLAICFHNIPGQNNVVGLNLIQQLYSIGIKCVRSDTDSSKYQLVVSLES